MRSASLFSDHGELEGEALAMSGSALAGLAAVFTGSTLGIGIPIAVGLALQYAGEAYKSHCRAPELGFAGPPDECTAARHD